MEIPKWPRWRDACNGLPVIYTSNGIEDVVGDPGGAGNVGHSTSRADEGMVQVDRQNCRQ